MTQARTEIGRVRSVNPSRREVRVTPRRGYASALNGRVEIEFEFDGGKRAAFAVQTIEEQERCVKLTLAESVSMDEVAALRGASVLAEAGRATPRDTFDVSAAELEGFSVADLGGNAVGIVASGFNTPAHGVIEIDRGGGRFVAAPFVTEVVASVDWDARRIVIRDVEAHMAEQDGGGTMA